MTLGNFGWSIEQSIELICEAETKSKQEDQEEINNKNSGNNEEEEDCEQLNSLNDERAEVKLRSAESTRKNFN